MVSAEEPPANTPRRSVPRRLRFEILRRDGHTCRYCGQSAPDVKLTLDHVVPVALGGSDDPTNLVTACADCNGGKSASSPDETTVANVERDALRWAAAIRDLAEMAQQDRDRREAEINAVDDKWRTWKITATGQIVERTEDWDRTVDNWLNGGLTVGDITAAIDKAMNNTVLSVNDKWRYTCGICWKTLKQRQDDARAILRDPSYIAHLDELGR